MSRSLLSPCASLLHLAGAGYFPLACNAAYRSAYAEKAPIEPFSGEYAFLTAKLDGDTVVFDRLGTEASPRDVLLVTGIYSQVDFNLSNLQDCWLNRAQKRTCCSASGNLSTSTCFDGLYNYWRCCSGHDLAVRMLRNNPEEVRAPVQQILRTQYAINETSWDIHSKQWRLGSWPIPPSVMRVNQTIAQVKLVLEVLKQAGESQTIFQMGVRDGLKADPVGRLVYQKHLVGLGVEADAKWIPHARKVRPSYFRVEHGFLTPENVWSWAQQLGPIGIAAVDIDCYECAIMESLLKSARQAATSDSRFAYPLPAALVVEINTMIPPPFKFNRRYHPSYRGAITQAGQDRTEDQRGTAGCSLSYAVHAFAKHGYDLLFYGSPQTDAVFIRRDLGPWFQKTLPGLGFPLDEFQYYRKSSTHAVHINANKVRDLFFGVSELGETFQYLRQIIFAMSDIDGLWQLPVELSL